MPSAEDDLSSNILASSDTKRGLRSEADLDITTIHDQCVDVANRDDGHASDHSGRHARSDRSERLVEPDGPRRRIRGRHAECDPRIPVQPLPEAAAVDPNVVLRLEREPALDVAVRGFIID